MQSSSISHHFHFQTPWPIHRTRLTPPKFLTLTTTNSHSLRTSIDYEPEESVGTDPRLPVVVQSSGRVSRYFWDGDGLRLIGVDGHSTTSFGFDFDDGIHGLGRVCGLGVKDFFIPKKVSENYMGYVKWKFLHRVFSSALQVLATQAMFKAIGIGYSQSLPSAAALNWVLKDGLGKLSRCIYTASLASTFNTNLKRVRFATSILYSLSIGVELLTPAFPKYFLLLASLANIAKQISLACYLATGVRILNFKCYQLISRHRLLYLLNLFSVAASAISATLFSTYLFGRYDNLGKVSAKSQIQTVCFDNLGLLLAAVLNMLFKNKERLQAGLPFVVYPIFSAIDLFELYQGLKHVHLQTLSKDRLEIILDTWIESGYVPSLAEVSKLEGIDLPWSQGKDLWPIRIGCINSSNDQFSKFSMMAMRRLSGDNFYFVSMETIYSGVPRRMQRGILLCLREGSGTADVTMGLLQACYIRKALSLRANRWENMLEGGDLPDLVLNEWFKLLDECKARAQEDLSLLEEQMSGLGWATKNILLNTREQIRYCFVDDK